MLANPIPRVMATFLLILGCLAAGLPLAHGQEQYALELSGATVTIDDDQDVLRLGTYTYEFWLKDLQGPTGSWRNIFCKGQGNSSSGRGPLLALRPNEQGLHYDHSTGSGQSTLNVMEGILPNEWNHVALVLTALDGDQKIYVNGAEEATRASAGLTDATQDPVLRMGMGANVVIDDFRVWDHARTEAEVQEHMAQELEGNEEGLVGYWKFNEGTGTIAYDSSPSEIHGTIADPAWRTDAAPIALAAAPVSAYSPLPAQRAVDVPLDKELAWKPGRFADTQDVYLGTAFDDVNDASRADPRGVLVSQGQSSNVYAPPAPLDFGQTYYWRVDTFEADGGTMHKGAVWSFTVEPIAYPIANVTASSNGLADVGPGPEKTIDGSGLNENGEHGVASDDMWLTSPPADEALYIEYAFDAVYKLHEMLVWNYNVQFELVLGFGLKDITVDYSENATDWMTLGDVQLAQGTASTGYAANTTIDFGGVAARYVRLNVNSGWGMIGQYGLSEVRFMYIPARAREPQPGDGATDVNPDTTLSWRGGRDATAHEVYIGVTPDELPLVESVSETTFTPSVLNFGTTYYWRIDAVGDEVWGGDLWSFVTQEYAVIDDMESYNDEDNTIYDTWLDGWVNETGSTVGYLEAPFAERSIVHGGSQSMPLSYDNSVAPFYSEAELDLGGVDWDTKGANTLRLFVAGQAPAFIEAADGSISMSAIGTDIWNAADQCRYVYKQLTGDGSMTVRVDYLDATPSTWAKGGVMVRPSTDPGAINAFIAMTGGDGGGATFQQRLTADDVSVSQHTYPGNPFAPPYWVRLERAGSALTASISPDGETWQQAGDTATVALTDPVLIGLALTSHNAGVVTSAVFRNISTIGNVTGSWQMAEIGVAQPTGGNDAEALYVAIEDSAGHVAVATHPDAGVRSGWTEWLIPYSDLVGVNLNSVRTMYIGLGDRNNPKAGGSGLIFIDDIAYGKPVAE
ncbi:MAG: LamG domain-containing protein [Phycisphaerales bacterium]|nr:MAG: LamG domain-containing protein [Phycisphaerales bacterium]